MHVHPHTLRERKPAVLATPTNITPSTHTFPSFLPIFPCLLLCFFLEPTRLQLLHQECSVTRAQKGLPSAETVHKLKDGEVRISTLREKTQDKLQQGLAGRGEGGRYRHTWESKTLEQTHTQYFLILVSNKTVMKTDTQFLILYKSWDPLPLLVATQDGNTRYRAVLGHPSYSRYNTHCEYSHANVFHGPPPLHKVKST